MEITVMMFVAVAVMVTVRMRMAERNARCGVGQRTRSAAVASAWSFSSAELGRDFPPFIARHLHVSSVIYELGKLLRKQHIVMKQI